MILGFSTVSTEIRRSHIAAEPTICNSNKHLLPLRSMLHPIDLSHQLTVGDPTLSSKLFGALACGSPLKTGLAARVEVDPCILPRRVVKI